MYLLSAMSFGSKSNMENSDQKVESVAQNILSWWSVFASLCLQEISITDTAKHWGTKVNKMQSMPHMKPQSNGTEITMLIK